ATFNEATIAQMKAAMASGQTSAVELTTFYLNRIQAIDERGPGLNSVIELNPDALAIAQNADAMRRRGRAVGPLNGIPILLKDNIDTGDSMQTTAGSFALAGAPAVQDSTVAAKLRAAGAVILGKANLSEWANFRSFHSSSGWSGRGGQCNNPYAIDRNPCGSSSGSGAAAPADLRAPAGLFAVRQSRRPAGRADRHHASGRRRCEPGGRDVVRHRHRGDAQRRRDARRPRRRRFRVPAGRRRIPRAGVRFQDRSAELFLDTRRRADGRTDAGGRDRVQQRERRDRNAVLRAGNILARAVHPRQPS